MLCCHMIFSLDRKGPREQQTKKEYECMFTIIPGVVLSDLEQAVQLPPLLVQTVVAVPPPLLNLHQLRLQGGLGPGVSWQEQAPAGLHRQDVTSLLPLEHPLPQLEEQTQGQWAEEVQVN